MSKNKYFPVGKILGTRGISGELKVQFLTDDAEDFLSIDRLFLDVNAEPLEILGERVHKSNILLQISSVRDRNSAEALRGKFLYAFREDIPLREDRYFIEDLKGLEIIDTASGKVHGILKDVINTGANDIYVVGGEDGKEYLLPIIDGTIQEINLDDEKIFVTALKGVFDDN